MGTATSPMTTTTMGGRRRRDRGATTPAVGLRRVGHRVRGARDHRAARERGARTIGPDPAHLDDAQVASGVGRRRHRAWCRGRQRHPPHRVARWRHGHQRRGHDRATHPSRRRPAAVQRAAHEVRSRPLHRVALRHPVPRRVADDDPHASRRDRRSGRHGQVHARADVPSVDVATNFFLVLTLVADAVVAAAVLLGAAALVSRRAREAWFAVAAFVGPQAMLVAWIVAIVTTLGSLYYSLHAGFVPCELCWYQRIAMYPLVVVLGVGWLRRDGKAWITALPFVVVGAPLSLYHWLVERVPSFAESSSCSVVAPCTAPVLREARLRHARVDVLEQLLAHRHDARVVRDRRRGHKARAAMRSPPVP